MVVILRYYSVVPLLVHQSIRHAEEDTHLLKQHGMFGISIPNCITESSIARVQQLLDIRESVVFWLRC